jgi:hypothetical protein
MIAWRVQSSVHRAAGHWASPAPPRSRCRCRPGKRCGVHRHVHEGQLRRAVQGHSPHAPWAVHVGRRRGAAAAEAHSPPCQPPQRIFRDTSHPPPRREQPQRVGEVGSWRFRGRDQPRANRPLANARREGGGSGRRGGSTWRGLELLPMRYLRQPWGRTGRQPRHTSAPQSTSAHSTFEQSRAQPHARPTWDHVESSPRKEGGGIPQLGVAKQR